MKNIMIIFFISVLGACSGNMFMPEKGGPNAFQIRTLEGLKKPDSVIASQDQSLPPPSFVQQKIRKITKDQTVTAILPVDVNHQPDLGVSSAALLLSGQTAGSFEKVIFDAEAFDAEMAQQYALEKEQKITTLDYILGRKDPLLDPVINLEEEKGLLAIF